MLTELQKRKLAAYFKRYDVDQNGLIERADFERMADNACEIYGLPRDSTAHQASRASFGQAWESLRRVADKNEDDSISLEEFMDALEVILEDKQHYDQFVLGTVVSQLQHLDRDGDGRLSREEFVALEMVFNGTREAAADVFQRLDRDKDGYVTTQELVQGVKEFFYSDDPHAPGNWLAGPF